MNLFLIFVFAAILILPLWEAAEGLRQSALEIIIDIKPGQTQTVLWTLASDKENEVSVLEITARGNGSEFLTFPKSGSIEPLQSVRVPIGVSIPADYPGGIELKPAVYATEVNEEKPQGNILFIITMKKTIHLNIAPNDDPALWVDWNEVGGTTDQPQSIAEQTDGADTKLQTQTEGGGCLIATATFGSELTPQVQMLREIRDNMVLQTQSGASFMTGFNQLYYSFSPTIADWERQNPAFKELVKLTITPMLTSLSILSYVDIDSEAQMIGYGVGIILLNAVMYFAAPALAITILKKRV